MSPDPSPPNSPPDEDWLQPSPEARTHADQDETGDPRAEARSFHPPAAKNDGWLGPAGDPVEGKPD